MHRVVLAVFAFALALGASAQAGPKQKQEAKRHIDRATKAHKEGKFDVALVELKAAYKLDPQVELVYAIGQVYAKLGQCGEATTYFKEFAVKKGGKPEVQQVVDEAIASCQPSEPPAVPEPTPAPTPTPTPDPVSEPAPTPTPPPGPVAAPASPFVATSAHVEPPPSATESRHWYGDVLGDALVIGGVVSVVVGLVVYHSATSDLDSAESSGSVTRYDQLVDDAHSRRTDSIVLVGAGGALAVAGLVHYLVHDDGHESRSIGLAPTRSGGLVTWTGGF